MFASFKLQEPDFSQGDYEELYKIGKKSYDTQKKAVHSSLDAYLSPDGSLKANEIEADWFPSIKADVFLSHSHTDEDKAIAVAGYLSRFGITTFIDSCVWGYANDLLRKIDKRYCVQSEKPSGGYTYDYDKRNYSTAHVHMILNGALFKMMDRTECLIFLDTPNALKAEDIATGKTNSCWIYSELLMSGLIQRKQLSQERCLLEKAFEHSDLSVEYDVDIKHLVNLTLHDIYKAACECKNPRMQGDTGPTVLNQLYFNKGVYEKR